MKKILVTGATGGLGGELVKLLSRNSKNNIVALVRDSESEKAKTLLSIGVETRRADYDDKETLVKAFREIDVLYFVSGSDIGRRLQQHRNVVQASIDANVKHIVYTSAGRKNESEEAPLFPVMKGHIDTEKAIIASGINYTLLRHNLYSEVIPMFLGKKEQILNTKMVYLPADEGKTAFAPREELAEAGAKILNTADNHINKVYHLNGSQLVSFRDVADVLSDVLGEKINYVSPSVPEFEATMKSVGLPDEIIGMMTGFSLGISQGEFEDEKDDLEVLLGRKTKNLRAFLSQVYA